MSSLLEKFKDSLVGNLRGFDNALEIIEKMLEYQKAQGNKEDLDPFVKYNGPNRALGGFDWHQTPEGSKFWSSIFNFRNFGTYYKKYPKVVPSVQRVLNPSQDSKPDLDFITGEPYVPKDQVAPTKKDDSNDVYDPFNIHGEDISDFINKKPTEDDSSLKLGDTVVVSDTKNFRSNIKVFIAECPELPFPILTVTHNVWESMKQGNIEGNIRLCSYKYAEKYTEPVVEEPKVIELTLEDISNGKGVGIPPHLIKII